MKTGPDSKGHFGPYGGIFIPETLMGPIHELTAAYKDAKKDPLFKEELNNLLKTYAGRPTPLYYARTFSRRYGVETYLKREDLCHTGAHKINNTVGQGLLAKRMGKTRIIAETGAGQHGVATAATAAFLGMECCVYMGSVDMERQEPNVTRMRLMGAEVRPVDSGSRTLKDAINEALRDWVTNVGTTHYLLGSALGPHPYPAMVRDFQSVIGREARRQFLQTTGTLPDMLVACVGGGSNALGLFYSFLQDSSVRMTGVEAGGRAIKPGGHAARFAGGKLGVLQGTKTLLLQDEHGQIEQTHSISAGLDYPAVGPEHVLLNDFKRVEYTHASDQEVCGAFEEFCAIEGIIPALESTHAIAYVIREKDKLRGKRVLVNLSGRGDKDIDYYIKYTTVNT